MMALKQPKLITNQQEVLGLVRRMAEAQTDISRRLEGAEQERLEVERRREQAQQEVLAKQQEALESTLR